MASPSPYDSKLGSCPLIGRSGSVPRADVESRPLFRQMKLGPIEADLQGSSPGPRLALVQLISDSLGTVERADDLDPIQKDNSVESDRGAAGTRSTSCNMKAATGLLCVLKRARPGSAAGSGSRDYQTIVEWSCWVRSLFCSAGSALGNPVSDCASTGQRCTSGLVLFQTRSDRLPDPA